MVNYPYVYPLAAGGEEPILIEKTITANGDYDASDDDADGFSVVHVAVPAPANKLKSLVDGSITSVTAEDLSGITAIVAYAFYSRRSLVSIEFPATLTTIGERAFFGCDNVSLQYIDIPDDVTTIATAAFQGGSGIKNLIIGTGVTSIANSAFQNCWRMVKIIIKATTPPTLSNANAFGDTNNSPIYVPTPDDYKGATNWSALSSRIFPLVEFETDLSLIDTNIYTKACVIEKAYKQYEYNGSYWSEVVES